MWRRAIFSIPLAILCSSLIAAQAPTAVPVFKIDQKESSIKFYVKVSVALEGTFDRWDANLTFASTDVTTGVLDIKIEASSVNTGSGMKDGKLKSKDFFNVQQDPLITFVSKKVAQTGPDTFELRGDFTIRGVTRPEAATLTVSDKGTSSGVITGTMAFDRKDYGISGDIPFIKVADLVEVTINLKAERVSGPPLVFGQ